jgi:putative transposase
VVISARVVIKRSPFRFFKTSPEIMRLAVRMYVRNPQFTEEIRKLGCALA